MIFESPTPFNKSHTVDSFNCGVEELNLFLKKYALQSQSSQASRTYVCLKENQTAGYYTLTYGSIRAEEAPPRISQGMGRYPIPVMLLARLAIDQEFQGLGLGESLLKDALKKTINASEIAGLRAIFVAAKDENAQRFYKKYGFTESPLNDLHLFLLMKDILKSVGPL